MNLKRDCDSLSHQFSTSLINLIIYSFSRFNFFFRFQLFLFSFLFIYFYLRIRIFYSNCSRFIVSLINETDVQIELHGIGRIRLDTVPSERLDTRSSLKILEFTRRYFI